VNNYCIAVKEKGDDIVFLRKIIKGGADKSYGIQVAKLAGLPDLVVDRAKEIVNELSANDITETVRGISAQGSKTEKEPVEEAGFQQLSLFDTEEDDEIVRELRELDITNLTPLAALNKLSELQNKAKNRW
jgi:DNA mismatch repair protein MutS